MLFVLYFSTWIIAVNVKREENIGISSFSWLVKAEKFASLFWKLVALKRKRSLSPPSWLHLVVPFFVCSSAAFAVIYLWNSFLSCIVYGTERKFLISLARVSSFSSSFLANAERRKALARLIVTCTCRLPLLLLLLSCLHFLYCPGRARQNGARNLRRKAARLIAWIMLGEIWYLIKFLFCFPFLWPGREISFHVHYTFAHRPETQQHLWLGIINLFRLFSLLSHTAPLPPRLPSF